MEITNLTKVTEYLMPVATPFNFRLTFWKPSHFPTGLEMHTLSTTYRTFRFGLVICGIKASYDGSDLHVQVFSSSQWDQSLDQRLRRRIEIGYGLGEDIASFQTLAESHPSMSRLLPRMIGMRMSCPESLFEIAIVSLLLQNTTIKRTIQMMNNLLENYGVMVSYAGIKLRAFFSPFDMLEVSEADLRNNCRLGYRAKYLPEFARYFAAIDDDELRGSGLQNLLQSFQEIKGVGPYTANVVASHALRDPSALALDVWNTKIFGRFLDLDEGSTRADVAEAMNQHFPGYAGLAGLYVLENEFLDSPLDPLVEER